MAQEFKLLYVLWLVVACLGTTTSETNSTTASPTTQQIDSTIPVTQAPSTTPQIDSTIPVTQAPSTTQQIDSTIPVTQAPSTTQQIDSTIPVTQAPSTTQQIDSTIPVTQAPSTTQQIDSTIPVTQAPSTTPQIDSTIPVTQAPSTTQQIDSTIPVTQAPSTTPQIDSTIPVTQAPSTTPQIDSTTPVTQAPSTTTQTDSTTTTTQTPLTNTTSVPTTTTTIPTTIKPPGPCDTNPCGRGSTCEARANQVFVCLCLAGDTYNYKRKSCETAKVFPGQLNLRDEFKKNMSDKTSQEFNETSQKIVIEMSNIFSKSDDYIGSIVLELRPTPSPKVESRSEGVSASIQISFNENSAITTDDVENNIATAQKCDDCFLAGSSFVNADLCDNAPCDVKTTNCSSKNGLFNCTCRESYVKMDLSDRICIACPSGQQALDSVKCVDCPFGYSGLNCNEPWQLVLVIVGSVLGGLLLITLILLPVVAIKTSKKSSKNDKNADIGKPYNPSSPAKAPPVTSNLANSKAHSVNGSSFTNPGVPTIPRATTTSNFDMRTNLEMTPSNSRQTLISADRNSRLYDDLDDMYPYSQSRPQSSGYVQARPQTNPYAQNRPQINPYAQSQGQTNPYYDGRRFNN